MDAFYKIVISDYKQRTRSYAFLVTLAISLYFAYAFLPAANAAYTTVRIGNYTGVQNAAWIGYVTAMMTSVFLAMTGFYLVNSGIKKDIDTGVGEIVATTPISNFNYLFAKACSNFLVLLSITGCVFAMSIALFFIRSAGYPFDLSQLMLPYLLVTLPTICFVAALAVAGEVFLHRYTILMNIGYFFFFCAMGSLQASTTGSFDLFGNKPVTTAMQASVARHSGETNLALSMGFNFSDKRDFHSFIFNGVDWTITGILSRLLWIGLGLLIIFISAKFFHRFDIKQKVKTKKKSRSAEVILHAQPLHDIKLSELPPVTPAYGIMPFVKTELLMLYRKGPRWLWIINIGGMIALSFAPLVVAHQMILPCLWFLQVARWSDLATKEKTNRIHYFTYASYKPLTRLLPAQMMAGIIIAMALASPLVIRYLLLLQFLPVFNIIMGSIFIVLFAVAVGILSGGKKLFEIIFFLFTYLNVEKVPFTDYFGGINHGMNYIALISGLIVLLAFTSFTLRKLEISRV
ncbi:hypothetical protein [Mucilaginibacter gotjawali]|uniref:Uncharacterized protein n=2 Tax=Mucilaginibacter gotjawali TaxID=1550579 RepID=A0A839SQB6_9SPHI|nr:hypothetical protein [Mucilaginibacter gotjawali]MBB3058659.1 hypothetical protein [Mucilaginibacter gotjawali]BAU55872.1 hypothetical protein MgSA37_04064 [Mucilaginibacter gotjawali]